MKWGFYGPEADAGPYLKNEGPFANSVTAVIRCPKNKKLALNSGKQTYQILTNDDLTAKN